MNERDDTELHLLLAHAGEHAPVLAEGLPHDAAGDQVALRSAALGLSFYDLGAAGNDLAAQGWGVIAPEGARGDELLARIRVSLIEACAEQLEALKADLLVSFAHDHRLLAAPVLLHACASDEPDQIPRYQLFLGEFHEVLPELQQVQALEGFVKALAFEDLADGHGRFHVEHGPEVGAQPGRARSAPRRRLLGEHARRQRGATQIGHRALIEPVLTKACAMQGEGRFNAGELCVFGDLDEPSHRRVASAPPPNSAPARPKRRTGRQRAPPGLGLRARPARRPGRDELLRRPWPPLACPRPRRPHLRARRRCGSCSPASARAPRRARAFTTGSRSSPRPATSRGRPDAVPASLPRGDQRPFIAALPQAAPGESGTAPAWCSSATPILGLDVRLHGERGRQEEASPSASTTTSSASVSPPAATASAPAPAGDRALLQRQEPGLAPTTRADHGGRVSPARRPRWPPLPCASISHLWMVRQDLAGYILLGDPAVQLPLTRGAKSRRVT